MNYKLLFFSAVITAVMGGLLGWSLSYIGQPDFNRTRFESKLYENIYHSYPFIGAGLGFSVGWGFALIRQAQEQKDRNGP